MVLQKNMSGGSITLYGNAGESTCSGMSGGIVKIFGSTKSKFCCMPTVKMRIYRRNSICTEKCGRQSIIRIEEEILL